MLMLWSAFPGRLPFAAAVIFVAVSVTQTIRYLVSLYLERRVSTLFVVTVDLS